MITKHYYNHNKTNIIPINNNYSSSIKNYELEKSLSLKQNFFDPSKISPPNDFMLKLQNRIKIYNNIINYNNNSKNYTSAINTLSFDKE